MDPHDAHEIVGKVAWVGADLEHLKKATAFEFNPHPGPQQAHHEFNINLIQRSGGLLREPTGEERLLTVACSHFSPGCRAAKAGCSTNEERISGSDGKILLQKLYKGDKHGAFQDIIEHGFEFTIIPFTCEEAFGPALADLAQQALNAEHGTYSQATELQVMSGMAISVAVTDGAPDWKAAIASTRAGMPPCHQYLEVLADFVKAYVGGTGPQYSGFWTAGPRHMGATSTWSRFL